jgi:hypothetical protein
VVCFLKPVSVVEGGRKYINQVLNLGLGNFAGTLFDPLLKSKGDQ